MFLEVIFNSIRTVNNSVRGSFIILRNGVGIMGEITLLSSVSLAKQQALSPIHIAPEVPVKSHRDPVADCRCSQGRKKSLLESCKVVRDTCNSLIVYGVP